MNTHALRRLAGASDWPMGGLAALAAADTAAGTPVEHRWPRQLLTRQGNAVTIYKPQIDTLQSGVVSGRVALSMVKKGGTAAQPGVATFSAQASVDREANRVTLTTVKVDRICFPTSPAPRRESTAMDPAPGRDLGQLSGLVKHDVVTCRDRSEPAPAAGARVLVVDDNPLILDLLAEQMHRRGLAVGRAHSGEEALERLAPGGYELVLLDSQMPGLDGRALARAHRARERANGQQFRLPMVAVTASDAAQDREECLAAGMDDFLTKPVRGADIDRILVRWLPATGDDGSTPLDTQVLAEIDDPAAPSFLAKVVDLFLADVPAQSAALAAAVRSGDWTGMARGAHSIKGSAANFGARHLVRACEEALHAAHHGGDGAADAVARIEHELARAGTALRQLVVGRLSSATDTAWQRSRHCMPGT